MTVTSKHQSIRSAVAALRERLGESVEVSDQWNADLYAVGLWNRRLPGHRVYFSTFKRLPDHYFVELEGGGRFNDVDFNGLARLVARHLGLEAA
jgi:hypothetical protein